MAKKQFDLTDDKRYIDCATTLLQLCATPDQPHYLFLYGPLGVGKTFFVKQLASLLGICPTMVTSPTYTYVNTYAAQRPLIHSDLYRLAPKSPHIEEWCETWQAPGIYCIEWPQILEPLQWPHLALHFQENPYTMTLYDNRTVA